MIMVSSLAGCGKQPEFPDELKTIPTPTRIHGGYRKNLYMWWDESKEDVQLLQNAWYDFYTIHAGEKYDQNINMFHMQGDVNGTTQLEQQVMAGTAPDLVKMDHVYITFLGQKGLLFDLQEKWQATDKTSNQFVTPTWEAFTSGEAVYGIPFDANTVIFGAKTDVLQQVGLSIPTNYTELQNVGTKMLTLSENMKPYYLPLDGYDWSPITSHYMTWLKSV